MTEFLHFVLTFKVSFLISNKLLLVTCLILLKSLLGHAMSVALDVIFPPQGDHLLLELVRDFLSKVFGYVRFLVALALFLLKLKELLTISPQLHPRLLVQLVLILNPWMYDFIFLFEIWTFCTP